MVVDNLEVHVDEILDALSEDSEKEVSRDELQQELKKFLEYGVPVTQAKQTLIKKFSGGGASFPPSSQERSLIADLQPNQPSVNLLCRIISINPKEITVRGEKRKIFYGIFGDESGSIPFTAWKDFEIEKGDVLEVTNAYTREWQGAIQVNLGDRVTVKKTEEELPESAYEPKELKIKDLRSGLGAVEVTARVLDINERETEVNGETKKVFSGAIGDETGKAQFTSWHDFGLKKGNVVTISGGYVKSWKGIPQLTFDERSRVKKLEPDKLPEDKIKTVRMPLHELVEKRGALDVEAEGRVIEIRPGSGLIMRCPECNRVLQDNECKIHGEVQGNPDIRIKLVVDDGTGPVHVIMNREVTEKILGKTLQECQKMVENSAPERLVDEIHTRLFARRVTLQGNALGDDYGTTVIARNADLVKVDIQQESERLSRELEELQ
jgi:replication factor A1